MLLYIRPGKALRMGVQALWGIDEETGPAGGSLVPGMELFTLQLER